MALTAADIMNARPRTIAADTRLAEAESWMRELRVQALVALDVRQQVCGVVQLLSQEPGWGSTASAPLAETAATADAG